MKGKTVAEVLKARAAPSGETALLDVTEVYGAHADFVWATLHRMGVRHDDLADVMQEVFFVVHRRRCSFDGSSSLRTWLFGICIRLAKNYHRKAHRRRERSVVEPPEDRTWVGAGSSDPEKALERRRARRAAEVMLDRLSPDKRAVFVMFEVEGLGCDEIAEQVGIPVGTVYSRLHTARRSFAKQLARWHAREGGRR